MSMKNLINIYACVYNKAYSSNYRKGYIYRYSQTFILSTYTH